MNVKNSPLALLIAAPHNGEAGMHHDVAAMYDAVIARGLTPEDILVLEGRLNRCKFSETLRLNCRERPAISSQKVVDIFTIFSYDIEKDYWEWEAAQTDCVRLREMFEELP